MPKCHKKFSPLEKQLENSTSMNKLSEPGSSKENLSHSELHLDKDVSLSLTSKKPKKTMSKGTKQSTVVSQVKNKKTISKDKLNSCKKTTKDTKSSKTLVRVSTSKEGDLSPFWTKHSMEWSKKLWFSQGTDCVGLRSNSLNGFSNDQEQNLPLSTRVMTLQNQNSLKMFCQSFKCSVVGEMANEGTIVRSYKIKLLPTKNQKCLLRKFEKAYRFTYNKALDFLKQNKNVSKLTLRTMFVTLRQNAKTKNRLFGDDNHNPFFVDHEWLLKTPKAIRQQATFEASKNFKLHKHKCNPKVKGSSWAIGLENLVHILPNNKVRISRAASDEKDKTTIRFQGHLHASLKPEVTEEDFIVPQCEVRLQKYNSNYYLIIPIQKPIKHINESTLDAKMIGLDPGLRKFLVGYGTDGRVVVFGSRNPRRQFMRTIWYKEYLDTKLRAKKDSIFRATGKERKALRKQRRKIQERMDNIRKDFHHKVANWITNSYEVISIGKLPKNIILRDRHLPKIVKKAYNALAHYQFRCCLNNKCIERGKIFSAINESYTSKTCTLCGCIRNVGSSETFTCPCSLMKWDRDLNGARNILIKSISESYLRIILKQDKTFSLGRVSRTQNPRDFSLGLDILKV